MLCTKKDKRVAVEVGDQADDQSCIKHLLSRTFGSDQTYEISNKLHLFNKPGILLMFVKERTTSSV